MTMSIQLDWVTAPPVIPETTFNIMGYGAVGDGMVMNTWAIQTAIDECAKAGGGRVIIPPGIWLTGPITLRNRIDLHVQAGALLLFSQNFNDYPLVEANYEGVSTIRCQAPINGDDLEDVAITGDGVIDGGGAAWRPVKRSKTTQYQWRQLLSQGGVVEEGDDEAIWWPTPQALQGAEVVQRLHTEGVQDREDFAPARDFLRPALLRLQRCRRILLDGPTFQNSPAWCLHFFLSEHITIRQIEVRNPWYAQNGDGIDLDSCAYVLLENSSFDVGDDAICLKSGKNESGRDFSKPSAYISIRGCQVFHGHGGFVVGSEMSGGIHDIHISDCTFIGTDVGLRFKSARGRGGVVENIVIDRIRMADIAKEAISFHMFYDGTENTEITQAGSEVLSTETPVFRNIFIHDVACVGAQTAILINELPELPIEGLVIDEVAIRSETGIVMNRGEKVTFKNVRISSLRDR